MRVGRWGNRRTGVEISLRGIGKGQALPVLLLKLIQPRSINAQLLCYSRIDSGVRVVRSGILGKLYYTESQPAWLIVVHTALNVLNPWIEPNEKEHAILPDRTAHREPGKYGRKMVFLRHIFLKLRVSQSPACRRLAGERVIPRNRRDLVGVHAVSFKLTEHRTMVGVRTFPHYHVDYATQRAPMLSLDSRVLDFHLLHEVKRHVGVREASDQVCRFLAFHKVGVFRVRTAPHGESKATTIGHASCLATAGAIGTSSAKARSCYRRVSSHQGFIACRWRELNDRLKR